VNTLSAFHAALRLCFGAGLALAVGLGQAQNTGRIKPVPQPVAPALPTTGLPTTGTPAATPSDMVVMPQPYNTGGRAYGAGAGAPATASMGAMGAMGALGAGPYSAVQFAQSFLGADLNRDGELTRAEAQRLTIAPYSFEDMDRNHDGIITRFEYDDAVR
jgi:hypothetical protein